MKLASQSWRIAAVALLAVLVVLPVSPRPLPVPEVRVLTFDEILDLTLQHEGGWYPGTGAHDPNPTMKGVTQRTYDDFRDRRKLPRQSVQGITDTELRDVYRSYWLAVKADRMGPLTATLAFDHAVNAGPHRARQAVQRALGLKPDGVFGPVTMAALTRAEDAPLAAVLAWERVEEYCDLARQPRLRPNLLSWIKRVVPVGRDAATVCLDSRSFHR